MPFSDCPPVSNMSVAPPLDPRMCRSLFPPTPLLLASARKLADATNGCEITGCLLQDEIPLPVIVLKNKVHMLVDGVPIMTLVGTRDTVSIMTVTFKCCLGGNVVYQWDKNVQFYGVSNEPLPTISVQCENSLRW